METALKQTFKEKVDRSLGVNRDDARLTLTYFTVAFIALLIGGFLGLFQGLERAGLMELPAWINYYQVLTAHGVLLVLVFTATFVVGYFYAALSHTLGGLLSKVRKMGWVAFGLMVIGVVFVTTTIVMGEASVLYTFYPPMQASPWFYIGLVFIVLGIWTAAFGAFIRSEERRVGKECSCCWWWCHYKKR